VVKNIVTALNSSVNFLPAFWIDEHNGNHYFLGAQYTEEEIRDVSTLENIPLTDPAPPGGKPPEPSLVKNVASISRGVGPLEVEHQNITRVTDVYVNVDGRDTASVADDIQKRLDSFHLPSGYSVVMRGEIQSMRESFQGLAFGLLMAVALVYLVMVAQFRSFLDPFIVLFAVPLGLVGVIAALLLTGTTVNIQSYIGSIFMVGIAVTDSVLLVEYANRLRAAGVPIYQAVVQARSVRMRPILMTTFAAVMGLAPMAFRFGTGAEAAVPLARAVIGGLLASTFFGLFVVPALYLMLKGRKETAPGEAHRA
jgi:multidrug efflux pump subunit AcrB